MKVDVSKLTQPERKFVKAMFNHQIVYQLPKGSLKTLGMEKLNINVQLEVEPKARTEKVIPYVVFAAGVRDAHFEMCFLDPESNAKMILKYTQDTIKHLAELYQLITKDTPSKIFIEVLTTVYQAAIWTNFNKNEIEKHWHDYYLYDAYSQSKSNYLERKTSAAFYASAAFLKDIKIDQMAIINSLTARRNLFNQWLDEYLVNTAPTQRYSQSWLALSMGMFGLAFFAYFYEANRTAGVLVMLGLLCTGASFYLQDLTIDRQLKGEERRRLSRTLDLTYHQTISKLNFVPSLQRQIQEKFNQKMRLLEVERATFCAYLLMTNLIYSHYFKEVVLITAEQTTLKIPDSILGPATDPIYQDFDNLRRFYSHSKTDKEESGKAEVEIDKPKPARTLSQAQLLNRYGLAEEMRIVRSDAGSLGVFDFGEHYSHLPLAVQEGLREGGFDKFIPFKGQSGGFKFVRKRPGVDYRFKYGRERVDFTRKGTIQLASDEGTKTAPRYMAVRYSTK